MSKDLTPFQRKSLERLEAAQGLEGRVVRPEVIYGQTEVYLRVTLAHVDAFIYADGAELRAETRRRHFEAADYSSEEDLIKEFIAELVASLQS